MLLYILTMLDPLIITLLTATGQTQISYRG
jgi:hypothetical protein